MNFPSVLGYNIHPMLRISLLSLLTALTAFAAEPTLPNASARTGAGNPFNTLTEVEGVSKEDLLKFRRAAAKLATDPALSAAREKIREIRQRAEFASDDEKKILRNESEAAIDKIVELTRAAIAKADPSLSPEVIIKISDALEKQQRTRAQGANKMAQTVNGKTFPGTEEKNTPRDPQADKKPAPQTRGNRGAVQVPTVAGVSPEDTAKFKAALGRAYQNADWKAARSKLQALTEKTQFLTGAERADMRPDFEAATAEMRKSMRAAVAQTDPTLTPEVIEKIAEAMEQQMRGKAK